MNSIRQIIQLLATALLIAAPANATIIFSDYDNNNFVLDAHSPNNREHTNYFNIASRGYDPSIHAIHRFEIKFNIDDKDSADEWGGFRFGTDPSDGSFLNISIPNPLEIDDGTYTFRFDSSIERQRALFQDLWDDGILRYQVFATGDPHQPADNDNDFYLDWSEMTTYVSDTGSTLGFATFALASLGLLRRRISS